jgi:hypothetical protein
MRPQYMAGDAIHRAAKRGSAVAGGLEGLERADAINIRIPIESAEKTAEATALGGPHDLLITKKALGMDSGSIVACTTSALAPPETVSGAGQVWRQGRRRAVCASPFDE